MGHALALKYLCGIHFLLKLVRVGFLELQGVQYCIRFVACIGLYSLYLLC